MAKLNSKNTILDLGCGYGRLTPVLIKMGFVNIVGYDPSIPLIMRAIQENPGAQYASEDSFLSGRCFDLILCFALFTSCPAPDEQRNLVERIDDLSHEQTSLYISDYETIDNPAYRERYEQRQLNTYGCFSSGKGIFRHHEPGYFDQLLPDWKLMNERTLGSKTMNGNDITIHQYLFVKQA